MSKSMPIPNMKIQMTGDFYRMHRRPAYPHIVLNDNYQGVKIIDPLNNQIIGSGSFPEQYSSSGIIDSWFFSAQGDKILTVCEEDRSIALIDLLDGRNSGIVEYPSIQTMDNLIYIWDDTLVFAKGVVTSYFSLYRHDNIWDFIEQRSIDVRIKYPQWRRTVDQLSMQGLNIQRVDSSDGTILYYDHLSGSQKLGLICWKNNEHWITPVRRKFDKCSTDGQNLFLLQEYMLEVVDRHDELLVSINASEGFHFWDVDIIPSDGIRPAALIILSSSMQQNSTQLLVYFVSSLLNT